MTSALLSVRRLERRLAIGGVESLTFVPGVNVLVGRPNTGKTKWLQTLDYLLGDPGENPYAGAEEAGLADKYDAANAQLAIAGEDLEIERRWKEPGATGKIFVNGKGMSTREFQHFLMERLTIPIVNYPKGNPASGQTWPELSFRSLLRHIYRQQRFWGDIADLQPEGEQHASLMQFTGLAELIFTEDYGNLIQLKMKVDRLKARRDQYGSTLNAVSKDLVSDGGLSVGANATTVREAEERLSVEVEDLRKRRATVIGTAMTAAIAPGQRSRIEQLGEQRVTASKAIEEYGRKSRDLADRLAEMRRYRKELGDELERLTRAEDAGDVLADLKITHCPACDQPVENLSAQHGLCFLCHQNLPDEPQIEKLGTVRLKFEGERLQGEIKEANELLKVLNLDSDRISASVTEARENLRGIEHELVPARNAVSALVQGTVSEIDMALGKLSERQRQIGRLKSALEIGEELTKEIEELERQIEPLEAKVDESARATDFQKAGSLLEDGMNGYLASLNKLRPGVWRHSPISVDVTRWSFSFKVGARRWQAALGGTDSLYFLMAYHYGLLSLSNQPRCHYPGFAVIDVPAEFAGEAVADKENFIVQPFIDLLSDDAFADGQLIITGAAFTDLQAARRVHLKDVYVA